MKQLSSQVKSVGTKAQVHGQIQRLRCSKESTGLADAGVCPCRVPQLMLCSKLCLPLPLACRLAQPSSQADRIKMSKAPELASTACAQGRGRHSLLYNISCGIRHTFRRMHACRCSGTLTTIIYIPAGWQDQRLTDLWM